MKIAWLSEFLRGGLIVVGGPIHSGRVVGVILGEVVRTTDGLVRSI